MTLQEFARPRNLPLEFIELRPNNTLQSVIAGEWLSALESATFEVPFPNIRFKSLLLFGGRMFAIVNERILNRLECFSHSELT